MLAVVRFFAAVFFLIAAYFPAPSRADDAAPPAQVAWRLLDYLAVDYSGAVSGGKIINDAEYAEMREFSASVRERVAALPKTPQQSDLVQQADGLTAAVRQKASPQQIALLAHKLADDLLAAYPTPLAPKMAPDVARGFALYTEQCASCHGLTGHGDGPNAKGLEPKPVAFSDATRARQRSLFGLYQVIGQGLDGTAMPSFAALPSEDRWALAYYIGSFAFDESAAKQGAELWKSNTALHARIPDLQTLSQQTPAALSKDIGDDQATELVAYLRRNPDALKTSGTSSLGIARSKLAESLKVYQAGDRQGAQELALAAYLDGVEPVEPALAASDAALKTRIEGAMGELRASLSNNAPAEKVGSQIERLTALLDTAERALAPQSADPTSSFLGAFTILLREGVEALLIVVAMIAFLGKAKRPDVLPYVHAGWISALGAGVLTWAAATTLISISGASREVTEGFGSLISAIVLISVGIWMHGKAQSDAWQSYINDKLSTALSRNSAWFLFFLAFIVVYREVFETILFFVALWSQGAHMALLAGAATAIGALALIAWILLAYSKKLPISKFFSYSSILIAILSVVLAGKGVAGLQEAGMLDIHPLAILPRIEMLGVFPTWEGFVAQLLTIAVIIVGFSWSGRATKPQEVTNPAS